MHACIILIWGLVQSGVRVRCFIVTAACAPRLVLEEGSRDGNKTSCVYIIRTFVLLRPRGLPPMHININAIIAIYIYIVWQKVDVSTDSCVDLCCISKHWVDRNTFFTLYLLKNPFFITMVLWYLKIKNSDFLTTSLQTLLDYIIHFCTITKLYH